MLNKIKGVKIEQEDGTLSDIIPIGVEIENVGTPGGSLDKDLKTIKSDIKVNKNKIKNLEGSIKGLASGSPLVANSIAEMIDTTKVYVNTTDGHWYYYNGSIWADGGVYQAKELADNSVTIEKTNFIKRYNILPKTNWIENRVYNIDTGEEQNFDGSLNRTYIPINENNILYTNNNNQSTGIYVTCYNDKKEKINTLQPDKMGYYKLSAETKYIRFSFWHKIFTELTTNDYVIFLNENELNSDEAFENVKLYSKDIKKDISKPIYIGDKWGGKNTEKIYVNNNKVTIKSEASVSDWIGIYFTTPNIKINDILYIKISNLINARTSDEDITLYSSDVKGLIRMLKNSKTDCYSLLVTKDIYNIMQENNFSFLTTANINPNGDGTTTVNCAFDVEIWINDDYDENLESYFKKQFNSLEEENNDLKLDFEKKINGIESYTSNGVTQLNNFIWGTDGTKQTWNSEGWIAYANVTGCKKAKISGWGWSEEFGYWLYSFKDKNGTLQKHPLNNTGVIDLEIEIPDTAVELLVNGKGPDYKASIQLYKNLTDFRDCISVVEAEKEKKDYIGMFFGDSITALSGDRSWINYFKEIIPMSKYYNLAVAGATLMDKNNTVYDGNPLFDGPDQGENNVLGNQVQKVINNLDNYEAPDFILIAIGTNAGINTDIDSAYNQYYDSKGAILNIDRVNRKDSAGAFRYCGEKLHELYPNAVIAWCTPIHAVNTTRNAKTIIQYANNLKLLCNLGSYYCIDTIKCGINGLHEISNGNGEDLLDGLHPNSHGAKKMGYYNACKFKKFLDKIETYKEV